MYVLSTDGHSLKRRTQLPGSKIEANPPPQILTVHYTSRILWNDFSLEIPCHSMSSVESLKARRALLLALPAAKGRNKQQHQASMTTELTINQTHHSHLA